jgi:hypothetical protein
VWINQGDIARVDARDVHRMGPIRFGSFNPDTVGACGVKEGFGLRALSHCGGDATLKPRYRKLERENCEENEKKFHTQRKSFRSRHVEFVTDADWSRSIANAAVGDVSVEPYREGAVTIASGSDAVETAKANAIVAGAI